MDVYALTQQLTFNEWSEKSDVGRFPPAGGQGQPNPVQFISQKFPAIFGFRPEKQKR